MPEREAFLRTICDQPEDDGPRLVYADWLEERGDPRGEFIRLQCERSLLPPADREARAKLTQRADELYERHGETWREALPALAGVTWREFDRGFVRSVGIDTADRFLRHAAAIFAAAPVVEIWFTGLDADGAAALARSEELRRIRVLKNLGTPTGDAGVAALVNSPNIANLRRMFFNGNNLTDEAARAIAESRYLGQLVTLFLHTNAITDAGARALAESKRLPRVENVYLVANEVREAGIEVLRRRWGEKAHV